MPLILALAPLALVVLSSLAPSARADCPEILVPAYQYPTVGDMWARIAATPAWANVGVILNPNSGPGTVADASYVSAVTGARTAGVKLYGYVFTSYGARPPAQVLAEVATYQSLYGPLRGVFLGEMDNQPASLAYYQSLTSSIHTLMPGSIVIGNPGTPVPEQFFALSAADVIVTYEDAADDVANPYAAAAPPTWASAYPAARFGHIIYNIPTSAAMRQTLALAESRHVGVVYITSDTLPNPYDTLPSYFEQELRPCAADFNCSQSVSVQDIFDFLGAWFAGARAADFNGVGGITVQDIFAFLGAWFAGC